MPVWGWVLIAIAAVVVIALVALRGMAKRKTNRLQERFGPEYERTIGESKNRREAESELSEREKRRESLDVRPLTADARSRYRQQWDTIQAQFVDSPQAAVSAADTLIQDVMRDRGYPVQDFEQRAADVSVDHPQVVANYREGHRLAETSASGKGSTEDLRQAMRHYRALFSELVDDSAADEPTARERQAADDGAVDGTTTRARATR
jgi:hypothetical protein